MVAAKELYQLYQNWNQSISSLKAAENDTEGFSRSTPNWLIRV